MVTAKKKSGSLGANKTTAKSVNHDVRLHKYYSTVKNIIQVFLGILIAILLITLTIKVLAGAFEVPELEPTFHRVSSGDTLWTIAKQYKPDSMTMDEYMAWVYEHNDTHGNIYPGDVVIMGVAK